MAGRGSETKGIGFIFSVGFGRYICSEGKNEEKNPPIHQLTHGHTRVEEEFGAC